MGLEAIPGGGTPATTFGSGTPAATGGLPPLTTLSADEAAELQRALSALDDLQPQSATRGVPVPRDQAKAVPDDIDVALDQAETSVSTDIYAFMALFTQLAQQMRQAAKEQRQTELQSQVTAINNAANLMIDAAEKRFAAAMVQGGMQIASGAVTVGSGIGSAIAVAKAKPDQLLTGSKFLTQLNASQNITSGSSQILTGMATMISASMELDAAKIDAEAKEQEALGTGAQARRDSAQEVAQNMADLIKDIREQLRAIAQSDIETNRGIARNI